MRSSRRTVADSRILHCHTSAKQIETLVRTDDKRIQQWDEFKAWLGASGPFDVVIDAANVGYFNQNFDGYSTIHVLTADFSVRPARCRFRTVSIEHDISPRRTDPLNRLVCIRVLRSGGFNYEQIEAMVKHYQQQDKKVLVVLHKRRTLDEQVPPEHRAMVAEWAASGVMFNCQPGNNDDWYWLYAAAKLGGRTLLVSNDEMRDHHFQMIHNRSFARWKERHQVHYSAWGRRVQVREPAPFSSRPQRAGQTWHFPVLLPSATGSSTGTGSGAGEEADASTPAPASTPSSPCPPPPPTWFCVQLAASDL